MMNTIIKYIQLSFAFDAAALQREVEAVKAAWLPHYNANGYEGQWNALPLRTINGSVERHFAAGEQDSFKDTVLMNECPLVKSITDSFLCDKLTVRLLNLRPGSVIKEHCDGGLCIEEGLARIHVPIQTNDRVDFYLDNEQMVLKPGSCWYMNFDLPHRLANNGDTDRIHLVFDCVANDWLKELFATIDEQYIKHIEIKDKRTVTEKKQMIKYLREMNTPTALEMAAQLEQEILIHD